MENNKLTAIIEDHALIEDFIHHMSDNIIEKKPMPDRIPSLNDSFLMDALSTICEHITALENRRL